MNQSCPLISIITVSYNAASTIEQTILSVINQNFEYFEYIIIDGGSTDGTVDIIKKYQNKLTFWISELDEGIYDAMNKGIRYARGGYIYFLGADDLLFDDYVLSNVNTCLLDERKVYYGNVLFKKRNIIYDGKFSCFKIVTRNISHQSIFYPKKIFNIHSFDTKYKIFADYALNLKLYGNSSYSFVYLPIIIALFNDEGVSGSNTLDLKFQTDRVNIIKNNFPYWIYLYRVFRTKLSNIYSYL